MLKEGDKPNVNNLWILNDNSLTSVKKVRHLVTKIISHKTVVLEKWQHITSKKFEKISQ